MKQIYLTLILVLAAMTVYGQTVERQVISSTGMISSNDGVSISSTVGEVSVETVIEGTVILTQGFQQPEDGGGSTTAIQDYELKVDYKVFPNPTSDVLNIQLDAPEQMEIFIELASVNGTTVERRIVNGSGILQSQMQVDQLPSGTYLLVMRDIKNNKLKTHQIQIIH